VCNFRCRALGWSLACRGVQHSHAAIRRRHLGVKKLSKRWTLLVVGVFALLSSFVLLLIPFYGLESDAPMFPHEALECGDALDILLHPEFQTVPRRSADYSEAPWGGGGGEPTQPFDFKYQASCLHTFPVFAWSSGGSLLLGATSLSLFLLPFRSRSEDTATPS
jgi:hypothetical protein